jgi:GPH family glycoside/pentoside/hexuronide:cation symporter
MKLVGRFLDRFKSKVPEKDRVPFWQKVAYGLGGPVEGTSVWIPQQSLTPVYNIGLGLNPALLGIITMLWRCWDAFSDPVMGNISDNARTRWGRRRPFIVLGAILLGCTMPLMWWAPRGMGSALTFSWLLVAGLIFYTCYTIWAMPYYSLQLEMSPDYDERTNITAYRAFPQQLLHVLAGWILAGASLAIFGTNADGTPDLVNGMRYISIILAVATVFFGLLPGLFVKERYYAKETSKQPKQKLIPSLKQTLSTKPFLILIAIVVSKGFGLGLVATLGFYVNAYYVCQGDITQAATINGVKTTMLFIPNLVAIPICTWLATHFGKKLVLYLVAISGIVGHLSIYIFYTPENPWLQIIPPLLISPIAIGMWLIVPAMQADVTDYDELKTGVRREGSFSAVFSWALKVAGTVAGGLNGFILVVTGFDIKFGAEQPEHVLHNLRNCYIWVPIVFLTLQLVLISLYRLSRERMTEIRTELEARRGVI